MLLIVIPDARDVHHHPIELRELGVAINNVGRDPVQPSGFELSKLRKHHAVSDGNTVPNEEASAVLHQLLFKVSQEAWDVVFEQRLPQPPLDRLPLSLRKVLSVPERQGSFFHLLLSQCAPIDVWPHADVDGWSDRSSQVSLQPDYLVDLPPW